MNSTDTVPASLELLQSVLGIGERQIQKLSKENNVNGSAVIHKIGRGEYDLLLSIAGYISYLRERECVEEIEEGEINPAIETALLKRTQRFKLELSIDEEKERLIDIDHVRTVWLEVQAYLNGQIDAIPGRMSSILATELDADTSHIYDILLSETTKIRESIASGLTNLSKK